MTQADQQNSQPQAALTEDDLLLDPDEGKEEAELWKELDAEDNAASGVADRSAEPPDEGRTADDGSDDAAGDGGAADQTSAQGDGEKPKSTQPPDDAHQSSGSKQPPDIWATATPELRAAHEAAQAEIRKLQQSDRSQRGRVAALQRQVEELGRRTAQQKPPASIDDQGAADQGFLASNEWKAFQEEYPEVSGPMGKVIQALQGQIEGAQRELAAYRGERTVQAIGEQESQLAEKHSDWKDVTADGDKLAEWLETQPRHIREAAMRNAQAIVDAEEVADVLDRYKGYLTEQGLYQPAESTQGGAGAQGGREAKPPGDKPGTGNNDALSRKRQRQLQSAIGAQSRAPGVAAGIPEDADEETIWKAFDAEERRQTARG